jgi:hypothetical protein
MSETSYFVQCCSNTETFLFYIYFIDRASRFNSLLMTNLKHFFVSLFITPPYMFHFPPDRHTKQSLTQTNHIR